MLKNKESIKKRWFHDIIPKLAPVVPGTSITILHAAQTVLKREHHPGEELCVPCQESSKAIYLSGKTNDIASLPLANGLTSVNTLSVMDCLGLEHLDLPIPFVNEQKEMELFKLFKCCSYVFNKKVRSIVVSWFT